MPGRNRDEAFRDFLDPLERSFRCLSLSDRLRARWVEPEVAIVTGSGVPFLFPSTRDHVSFTLQFALTVRLIPFETTQYRMTTQRYIYDVHQQDGSAAPTQIVRWHWHPQGRSRVSWPHIHLPAGAPYASQVHVPAGRVSFEQVAMFLIGELDVVPAEKDWARTLMTIYERHVSYRTWN